MYILLAAYWCQEYIYLGIYCIMPGVFYYNIIAWRMLVSCVHFLYLGILPDAHWSVAGVYFIYLGILLDAYWCHDHVYIYFIVLLDAYWCHVYIYIVYLLRYIAWCILMSGVYLIYLGILLDAHWCLVYICFI